MSSPLWNNLAARVTAVSSDPVCAMYRFVIPIRAMLRRSWCSATMFSFNAPNFQFLSNAPLLIQRHVAFDDPTLAVLDAHGARLVHDIDDLLWNIPPDNPNAAVHTPELIAKIQNTLRHAQVVTTTTEPLAGELATLGIRATLVPNVLDPTDWQVRPARRERTRLRVGWYGQQNVHIEDLNVIETVVRALADRVDFVFFGDLPHGLASEQGRFETYATTSIDLFPVTLAALDLDLLLSPLAKNRFNECKSNLRLLQAGMLGYAVIATDIEAHRGLPVTLVSNDPQQWIRAIRERVGEIDAVRVEGRRLEAAVNERYIIDEARTRARFEAWFGRAPVTA